MISAEQFAQVRALLQQGQDAAQVAAQLSVDVAQVVGIAQAQPLPSTTSAADRPVYRHRKYS
jgi:hypothetical protein